MSEVLGAPLRRASRGNSQYRQPWATRRPVARIIAPCSSSGAAYEFLAYAVEQNDTHVIAEGRWKWKTERVEKRWPHGDVQHIKPLKAAA